MSDGGQEKLLSEEDTWKLVSTVATDLHQKHQAARRGIPIAGFPTQRVARLVSVEEVTEGQLKVTIEKCFGKSETVTGHVTDTPEGTMQLGRLLAQEQTVIPALRSAGYPV